MVRARDLHAEREITHQAAAGVTSPDALIADAEARAEALSGEYVIDAMSVRTDRDRLKDAREELADFRNHLTWHIEAHPEDPRAPRWRTALGLACLAYQELAD